MLDEVIRFERERLLAWVQRYRPLRSWAEYGRPRPVDERTVTALHAVAVALWDARRHPDRELARRDFEALCALVLHGTAQMFGVGMLPPTVERSSGGRTVAAVAERSFEEATRPPYTIIRS